jgi:hypothetical protein
MLNYGQMYCRCHRNNPDQSIRQARRDFLAQPDDYGALERWLNASMRAGQVLLAATKKDDLLLHFPMDPSDFAYPFYR